MIYLCDYLIFVNHHYLAKFEMVYKSISSCGLDNLLSSLCRCTYLSVMLSAIYLWHKTDLDMLVLARTPPGSSWKNPAERVMAVLNLGLQSVGVMRTEGSTAFESRMKK